MRQSAIENPVMEKSDATETKCSFDCPSAQNVLKFGVISLLIGALWNCAGFDAGIRDCVYPGGGMELCGPEWDSDGDTISTATEVNAANHFDNGGFYALDTLQWDINFSLARGERTFGSLFRGMNLRDSNTAYTHYDFCDGVDQDDWGTGHLVRLIEGTGRWWSVNKLPAWPLLQVGDLSLREGGYFPGHPGVPGCEEDHAYHQQGVDVDIRYLRYDGEEEALNICEEPASYDTEATIELMNSFLRAEVTDDVRIDSIFVDLDCVGIEDTTSSGRRILFDKAGHQNHFHVRIADPDGPHN